MLIKKEIITILTIIGVCSILSGQTNETCRKEAANMMALIKNHHVSPPIIDNIFSEHVFNSFFYQLDPDAIYFTAEDYSKLETFKYRIDDELNGNSWNFLKETGNIYQKSLRRTDSIFNTILTKSMDLTKPESLITDTSHYPNFYKSGTDYNEYIRKWLKKQVLRQLIAPNYGTDSVTKQNPTRVTKEEDARKKTLIRQQREIKGLLEYPGGIGTFLSSIYLNSIALCSDPHTEYMSDKETQIFKAALSSENLSFGIQVDENNLGEIEIKRLSPGGPAWKSNELNEGDIILKIQWLGDKEQDLYGMNIYETDEILSQPDKKQMTISVRKKDGSIKKVMIIKAKITQDNNIVKGYVLNSTHKIGYISLPGFYTSFENQSSEGCANDVAKEIIKLQKDKIQGLILDLRFNGGGSMNEAIDLSGIFFDYGPVAMTKDHHANQSVLKDMNKGSIYNGPLVILVNGQSASASEVVAAALQDYNRAVIVGNTTFGKASSQIIIPNDTTYAFKEESAPLKQNSGFLKLTINRLYRITGQSIQQRGVIPDICVPDIYTAISEKESSYAHALIPDSITKKSYFKPLNPLPLKELKEKSMVRQSTDARLLELNKNIRELSELYHSKRLSVPLDISGYHDVTIKTVNLINKLESISTTSMGLFSVETCNFDDSLINFDPETKKIYEYYYMNIKDDMYIQEAYNILVDFIELNNTIK